MRNVLWISLAVAAMSGCSGSPPLPSSSTTQGTTAVRTAVITAVTPPATAGGPSRLGLRYDNGSTVVVDVETSEVFKVGETVRVTSANGTRRIERLDADVRR